MLDIGFELSQIDNPHNYRCDKLTDKHDGKHILFLGDSVAAGIGLNIEETWCYKVYQKIKEKEKVSGYYNIAVCGSSIGNSIDNFFKYCREYKNPDIVFFITTEYHRDLLYSTPQYINLFNFRMYLYLDQYCKSNNIQLYSFSWIKSIGMEISNPIEKEYFLESLNKKVFRSFWTEQSNLQKNLKIKDKDKDVFVNTNILKHFNTFYDYTKEEMMESVYKYDKQTDSPKSLWAEDLQHQGTSFHNFYADFIYSKYLEKNDNLRN